MTNLLWIALYLLAGGIYLVGLMIWMVITLCRKYGIDKAINALSEATELLDKAGKVDSGWMNITRNLVFWPVRYTANAAYLTNVVIALCEEQ